MKRRITRIKLSELKRIIREEAYSGAGVEEISIMSDLEGAIALAIEKVLAEYNLSSKRGDDRLEVVDRYRAELTRLVHKITKEELRYAEFTR